MYSLLSVEGSVQSFVRRRNPKIVIMSEGLLPKDRLQAINSRGERIAIRAELLPTKCNYKEAPYHV
jgi:hypothetical protein